MFVLLVRLIAFRSFFSVLPKPGSKPKPGKRHLSLTPPKPIFTLHAWQTRADHVSIESAVSGLISLELNHDFSQYIEWNPTERGKWMEQIGKDIKIEVEELGEKGERNSVGTGKVIGLHVEN